LSAVLLGASPGWTQPVPRELSALVSRADLPAPVGWCRGELRAGRRAGYAVAVPSAVKGGRYLVLEEGAPAVELAPFTSGAELSCYSPAEARRLDGSIRQSETIQGGIAPRWRTTVVCGFLDDTTAVCWQYSPDARAFVKVGGWIT
jgi:hypothetical protein